MINDEVSLALFSEATSISFGARVVRFDDKPVTVDEELLLRSWILMRSVQLLLNNLKEILSLTKRSKGFSPKEWIYLKCSSKLGWMNATVELELYFAEGDVCTSMESYSPRNELEALNSIVWLTDVSLSTCTHLHTNILQGLRLTILDLISDFGDKNGVNEVVKKNHSCDQEECLIESGESNDIEGADQGAIARKDLKVGDVALEIPVSIIISEELLHETDMLRGSLENELEVLENLKDIFDDMMENMGEIDLDNGENCSWDEKLAMDFKDLQIRIACSVSTSCHTGMDMLKNELCKCMAEDILG
ncbi:hypothetical protein HKD37_13G036325 [Glycine soja]